ncbi:hypothetical protein B0H14DRAFT_3030837 [Mycena olivaceomarginata]|nr:hypothetical protein B0H14DRAFT_3030837 [Mycena olivaceomarginata]
MPSCALPSNHRGTDHLGLSFSFFTALFSPKTLLETSTPLWPLPDVLLFMSSCLIPSKANYAAARQRPLAHPTLHLSHLLRILGPRRRRSTSTSWATPHLHLYPSTRRGRIDFLPGRGGHGVRASSRSRIRRYKHKHERRALAAGREVNEGIGVLRMVTPDCRGRDGVDGHVGRGRVRRLHRAVDGRRRMPRELAQFVFRGGGGSGAP